MTVALCVSLVAHGGVVWTLLEGQVRDARQRIAQVLPLFPKVANP